MREPDSVGGLKVTCFTERLENELDSAKECFFFFFFFFLHSWSLGLGRCDRDSQDVLRKLTMLYCNDKLLTIEGSVVAEWR
jgi:hypothetical protein